MMEIIIWHHIIKRFPLCLNQANICEINNVPSNVALFITRNIALTSENNIPVKISGLLNENSVVISNLNPNTSCIIPFHLTNITDETIIDASFFSPHYRY